MTDQTDQTDIGELRDWSSDSGFDEALMRLEEIKLDIARRYSSDRERDKGIELLTETVAAGFFAVAGALQETVRELRKLNARSESFAKEAEREGRAFEERSSSERPTGDRSDS